MILFFFFFLNIVSSPARKNECPNTESSLSPSLDDMYDRGGVHSLVTEQRFYPSEKNMPKRLITKVISRQQMVKISHPWLLLPSLSYCMYERSDSLSIQEPSYSQHYSSVK
jgi:hypothetical protein